VTVVDLTIMWSGPLATWLLHRLGARVVKVEPSCRFDGTRFSPGGRLFDALNAGKERADLDLRRTADRRAFDELVAAADLVVDNFSPRVAPNLRTTHRDLAAVNPTVLSLSLPAFPPGPQRDWVSYGTGVHAASGLGDVGGAAAVGFAAPIVTYPDALGGLTAAVAALALVVARDRGARPGHAEVALADAVAPLRAVPDDGALLRPPDPTLVVRLARRLGTPPPSPLTVEGI
jgi:crotonobetainyl-CoA:carnitine CoA-transferase CaiB-like acyl-CoA transferase